MADKLFWGEASRVVMEWDTPDEVMEIARRVYPNAEVVRAEKEVK
ncbi:MAG: hypothetical protein ACRCX2_12370 [Paraclostridium sp.]